MNGIQTQITLEDIRDNKSSFVQNLYLPILVDFFNAVNTLSRSSYSVLDIGCGSGLLLRFNPAKVKVGLDLRITASKNPDVNFVRGDAHYLPFRDDGFHCTIMIRSLAYLDDVELALREIERVTKIDGIIIVSILSRLSELLYFLGKVFVFRLRSLMSELRDHKHKFDQEKLCKKILGQPYKSIEFDLISNTSLIKGEKILVFRDCGTGNKST